MEPANFHLAKTDTAYRATLRFRAQTDLFWLAKFVLGYSLITEEYHHEVADFFLHKDPRKPFEEQDPETKFRWLILPRRTYKTTFDIADAVQYHLCWPEIAIMAMTASNSPETPLATAFVEETAMHFYKKPEDAPKRLHILFPEYVTDKRPKGSSWISPARKNYRRDPTFKGVSIEQSLSGWHPDVIKSEDVVDNRNSQTATGLKKVRKNFYINIKMLPAWGFVEGTATRYNPSDLTGHIVETQSSRIKVLWKPAYIRKPHALKLEDNELKEQDVILQFPNLISWQFLRDVKKEDEETFWTQFMNIAEGNFKPTFPREKLEAAKIHEDNLPLHGSVRIAWRFEYGQTKHSAGVAALEWGGRVYVAEVICDSFSAGALARRVVALAKRWETHTVEIEDTPGARNYAFHLRNEELEQKWNVNVAWHEWMQDDGERDLFVKAAEPHLESGRLLFSDHLENEHEVFRQLYHFGLIEEKQIPVVIARITSHLPSVLSEEFDEADEETWRNLMEEDAYQRIYGPQATAPAEEEEPEQAEEETPAGWAAFGLEEVMPGLSG
jgi:hypothetical protein